MKEYIKLATGDSRFNSLWAEICRQGQQEHDDWVNHLRGQRVKAAHPDDGWVDRKNNTVLLCYPQFDDGVKIGSKIALGSPGGETRIVTVTALIKGIIGPDRWAFTDKI